MNYDWIGMYGDLMGYVHTVTLITVGVLVGAAALGYLTKSGHTCRNSILALVVLFIVAGVLRGYGIDILPADAIADFFAGLLQW